jgi:hypothetical protein
VYLRKNEHIIYKLGQQGFHLDHDATALDRTAVRITWFKETLMVFRRK